MSINEFETKVCLLVTHLLFLSFFCVVNKQNQLLNGKQWNRDDITSHHHRTIQKRKFAIKYAFLYNCHSHELLKNRDENLSLKIKITSDHFRLRLNTALLNRQKKEHSQEGSKKHKFLTSLKERHKDEQT